MATAKEKDKNKKVKRPTALKRNIQNEKRRLHNKAFRSRVRTAVRQFRDSLNQADKQKQRDALNLIYSLVDKGVNNKTLKINRASRIKARLTAHFHAKSAS